MNKFLEQEMSRHCERTSTIPLIGACPCQHCHIFRQAVALLWPVVSEASDYVGGHATQDGFNRLKKALSDIGEGKK